MAALLDPAGAGAGHGGAPARRAMVRWSWRLFRREWRGQLLLITLLALTVASAIFGGSAAYNVAPSPNAQFGSATQLLSFDGADPHRLAADIFAARKAFGTIEVIGHRYVPIPGSVKTAEFRAQSPSGTFGGPMLALRGGSYPTSAGETALTAGLARTLGVGIGGSLTLGGQDRRVVGMVENPLDLSEQFALVPPAGAGPAQSVTVLLKATPASFAAFRSSISPLAAESLAPRSQTAVAFALVAATLLLLLIALVAAAGFAAIAQRRLRQLGMLAAIGATQRHIRSVMLADGALVGLIAAVAGTAIGAVLWMSLSPLLEAAANHRIARLSLPGTIVVAVIVLALVTAVGAAWWPARMIARVPITEALSSRPPRPRPARRSAWLGAVFFAVGAGCLALARQKTPPLLIAGMLGVALGILYVSPLAIRSLAVFGRSARIGVRLPLRDLARHQARSAAALAAISLALAIAFAIIVAASAAQHTASSGNLSSREILVRMGVPGDPVIPAHTPGELHALASQVDQIAATLPGATVIVLQMPFDPALKPVPPGPDGSPGGQPVAELDIPAQSGPGSQSARQSGSYSAYSLYVATPALLRYLGVDPTAVRAMTDIVSAQTGVLTVQNVAQPQTITRVQRPSGPVYTSAPTSAMTLSAIRRLHWKQITAGWLLRSSQPLTSAQLAEARHVAALAGLTIETRDAQSSLGSVRLGAACAGILLALGVLALTVGLIRNEAATDLRNLLAAGGTARLRRMLTAATAGGLALLGVVLGLLSAYLGLVMAYSTDLGRLRQAPVLYLLTVAICVPATAFLGGWLLAGRPPRHIARSVTD
jgi:putative ABC transport system permease protein